MSINKFERYFYSVIAILTLGLLLGAAYAIFKYHSAASLEPSHSVNTAYVDNALCAQCHQPETKAWMTSHHAMAMNDANEVSVLADFNNAQFKRDNVNTHFFKRDQQFYINTQGEDGEYKDFLVKYTFGLDPIQQYLIELSNGRLQNFTIAWDAKSRHWFDLYPQEKTPPGDVLHWAGHYQNANFMCVSCHTTNYQKNYSENTQTYTSTWSQMNVACQACHGPGEQHVRWAKEKTQAKNKGLMVNFKQNQANTIVETCGVCHARRSELNAHAKVGEPLLDNYLPALLSEGLYYPDGQQQAEVYVYNSFRQSKMYQMGVSCIDCHNSHTGKLKFTGNAVCTQCHSPEGDKRFSTAAKLYDDPIHTFHQKNSVGAQCVSCHMPSKKYMMIHARPDHSIRIPRPDLSMKLGTPNACTSCHTNKSAQWANEWMQKWYGKKQQTKKHYGETFAAARSGNPDAEAHLIQIANDASQPSVIRATALNLLARYASSQSLSASIDGLHAADPAMRQAALLAFETLSAGERVQYVAPLLNDPLRAVRIEAARVLSSVPFTSLNVEQQKIFTAAYDEYVAAMQATIDMPTSNFNLAVVNENRGNIKSAETYYLHALQLDPDFTPSRLHLAKLYSTMQRQAAAENILQAGIQRLPQQGELHYSLGLLFAENNHTQQAVKSLANAVKYMPMVTRVRYNYALALQQAGDRKQAETELLTLQHLEPHNVNFIYALAVFYSQDNAWQKALQWAEQLKMLNPDNAQIQQFVMQIQAKVAEERV